MARVQVENDCVDISFGLLEGLSLGERSRRVPFSHILGVETYPGEWADLSLDPPGGQRRAWASNLADPLGEGAGSDRGAARLRLDLCDEDVERVVVELDEGAPDAVADRIRLAVAVAQTRAIERQRERSAHREVPSLPPSSELALPDSVEEGIPSRITPLPRTYWEPARPVRLDDDGSLAQLGGWLIGLGLFSVLTGAVIVAAGALPGMLAMGAGVASALMGCVALAVVLYHQ